MGLIMSWPVIYHPVSPVSDERFHHRVAVNKQRSQFAF